MRFGCLVPESFISLDELLAFAPPSATCKTTGLFQTSREPLEWFMSFLWVSGT